jgi:hypothetical protein
VDAVELIRAAFLRNLGVPVCRLVVAAGVKRQRGVRASRVSTAPDARARFGAPGLGGSGLVGVRLGDRVQLGFPLDGAGAAAAMITAAAFCRQRSGYRGAEPGDQSDMTMLTLMTLDHRSQVHALVCLLPTVALDVRRARLAHRSTVLALRYRPSFLVDVLERPICTPVLARRFTSPRPNLWRDSVIKLGPIEGALRGHADQGTSSVPRIA